MLDFYNMFFIKKTFFAFCLFFLLLINAQSYAQDYQDRVQSAQQRDQENYKESALRRAEIVFTISVPFTAIHSYFAVRGVEMAKQGKVSPKMGKNDWRMVAGLTITFSGFVAFWDWLHTRNEIIIDRSLSPSSREINAFSPFSENMEFLTSSGSDLPGDIIFASLFLEF